MKLKTSRSGNVPTKFLKDTVDFVSPILACIFNKSVEKGYFPSILKTAIVSPIIKAKVHDPTQAITDPFQFYQ